jgi:DNA-binding transcriptional LysR family regulator
MDLSHLHAFVVVADTASFSLAAEHLHLTQPAVSKRIRALERQLDRPLFDRIGRTVSLTEAGEALLPHARRVLREMEDGRRAVADLSGEVGGHLRLATSHHISLHRLPPVLKRYVEEHPEVHLDLRFMDSEAALRAVEHGELELAVVTLPPEPPTSLEVVEIWPDPLVVVALPDHPLALNGARSPRDVCRHPAILPGQGTFTRQLIESAFERFGVRPREILSTNYLETIRMLVGVGLGWSVLPRSMLSAELRVIEVRELHMARRLGRVHHLRRTLSNAARAMIERLDAARPRPGA